MMVRKDLLGVCNRFQCQRVPCLAADFGNGLDGSLDSTVRALFGNGFRQRPLILQVPHFVFVSYSRSS